MFKFAVPIILIGVAVAGFFMFVNPLYKNISDLRTQEVSYNEALNNSKSLEAERDKLTQKYNSIDLNNLAKLQKLLPDNVDNIRLILEIEGIASPYGMVLKDVKYDTTSQKDTTTAGQNNVVQGGITTKINNDYGTWNLEFSTQGTYSNFLNFIKDLEKNLRIVDISSVEFSSSVGTSTGMTGAALSPSSDSYKYTFKINTYWLKN
jgi:Tfp pilus assembly protein PilO